MANTRAWGAELDDLLKTMQAGVSRLTADAGVAAIDHWQERLTEAETDVKDDLKPVGRDLAALRKLLEPGEDLDSKKIGRALVKLAEHVETMSDSDDIFGVKGRLRDLGRTLRSEGELLGNGQTA